MAFALALRALGFHEVFHGDDVIFVVGDPYYHLRRALLAWTHFPWVPDWDSYLNFPDGAFVPWPPLYDFLVAGSTRLVRGSPETLEVIAAWWPPVLSSLTLLPVYAVARRAGGRGCGLLAALIFAVLPAAFETSRVGYADHHAAVAFLGTLLLALQVSTLDLGPGRARGVLMVLSLGFVRAALVLTWSGSITYLAVAETAVVLTAALLGLGRALRIEAASLLGTALLVAPFAARAPAPNGGPFSAIELSWLQATACVAVSCWAIGCSALSPVAGARSLGVRWGRTLGVAALLAAALLGLPAIREGIASSIGFLGKGDVWGPANPEQASLLTTPGGIARVGGWFGDLGFLLPLAPLLLAWRARGALRPGPLYLVTAWTAAFSVLAFTQIRFVTELAPVAAVALAILLAELGGAVAKRAQRGAWLRLLAALALAIALLGPAAWREHAPRIAAFRQRPHAAASGEDAALRSSSGTLVRFAQTVRAATPETAGFLDPSQRPEYGILSDPTLGHLLNYVARRPTVSGNFGPYVGRENFLATLEVIGSNSEADAFESLKVLGARYLVTSWLAISPEALFRRLHQNDGRESGRSAALRHFRLIAEGPAGGRPLPPPLGPLRPSPGQIPYKLFEVVEGAVLEVEAEPDDLVAASVSIVTPEGRRFVHRVRGMANREGRARLRVPYATRTETPVGTDGDYLVSVGSRRSGVEVTEEDVREGRVVAVPRAAGSANSP